MLKNTRADIAQRVSDNAVLCILVAWNELTSEVPQFTTKKTGKEEDILEYEGGMQRKSILVHEFGHVIHKAGFDEPLEKKLIKSFESSMKNKFWPDGRAAQRFRRVKSATPVSLLTALTKSLPDISEKLLIQCLDNGDTLVNGKRSFAEVKITVNDKVLIVFGGEILASEGSLATGGIYLGRCPNLLKRRAS